MHKRFDLKKLMKDRDGFVARLELAFALERPKPLRPPPPPTAEADTTKEKAR